MTRLEEIARKYLHPLSEDPEGDFLSLISSLRELREELAQECERYFPQAPHGEGPAIDLAAAIRRWGEDRHK